MAAAGTSRQDLYTRLTVIPTPLPPLRQRLEDVPPLAQFLLARITAAGTGEGPKRLGAALAGRLRGFPWPGNVRALEHALKAPEPMGDGEAIVAEGFPSPPIRAGQSTSLDYSPANSPC